MSEPSDRPGDAQDLADVANSQDELTLGGDGGVLTLRRSELDVLRRSFMNRIPSSREDCRIALDAVMDTLKDKNSPPRTRLAAAKTFAIFEQVNLAEFRAYLESKQTGMGVATKQAGPQQVNVQIVEQLIVNNNPKIEVTLPNISEELVQSNGRDHSKDI